MAAPRVYITCALLLIGLVLLGQEGIVGAVACPQYCLEVDYVTCPSSGAKKLPARCNCCMTPKNCTLHLSDGTQMAC
ncbi:hypothetical protein HU200_009735 [Digitaria exilis]|uniref:Uncharacterized protein n=1 Tax=Digitaria exilis TaxID=1010633 RepID=A0A835FJJ1_9POAL|nr:hypothetical protein HU200_009735 [Digitaria exilis]